MKKTAFIYIVIAGVLWGSSSIFFNVLSPYGFTSLQMTAMRGVVSAIAMTIYVLLSNPSLFKIKIKHLALLVFSGMCLFGTAAFYYIAMAKSSASTAVIILYTAPVFVMMYSVAFLGERINTIKVLSVITVIVGCALVSGVVGGMDLRLVGIAWSFAASFAYSAYTILTKIQMLNGVSPISASLYGFIFMGAISLMFCEPLDFAKKTMQAPFETIPLIIGIGICTCVLPFLFYTLSMRHIPAGVAASLAIIEPLSATIFSVAFFGEVLGIPAIIGIVLILGAIVCLGKSE